MVADSKWDMQVGADAVHFDDFVVPPPPWGTLAASQDIEMGGLRTRFVYYELPDEIGDDEAFGFCTDAITSAGLRVDQDEVDGAQVVTGAVDGQTSSVFVTIEADDGVRMLALSQVEEVP